MSGIRKEHSNRIDLFLTEHPPSRNYNFLHLERSKTQVQADIIYSKEVQYFVTFVKKVMKTTGYAVLIMQFYIC